MASYVEAPNSSSLYNLHEPTNGIYGITRSDHVTNRPLAQQRFKHINQNTNSQSETNLPNLQNYSPTNLRTYSRLGSDSNILNLPLPIICCYIFFPSSFNDSFQKLPISFLYLQFRNGTYLKMKSYIVSYICKNSKSW